MKTEILRVPGSRVIPLLAIAVLAACGGKVQLDEVQAAAGSQADAGADAAVVGDAAAGGTGGAGARSTATSRRPAPTARALRAAPCPWERSPGAFRKRMATKASTTSAAMPGNGKTRVPVRPISSTPAALAGAQPETPRIACGVQRMSMRSSSGCLRISVSDSAAARREGLLARRQDGAGPADHRTDRTSWSGVHLSPRCARSLTSPGPASASRGPR